MNEDVFPIQDGDFPASYVCLPEGISFESKLKAPGVVIVVKIHRGIVGMLIGIASKGFPIWLFFPLHSSSETS